MVRNGTLICVLVNYLWLQLRQLAIKIVVYVLFPDGYVVLQDQHLFHSPDLLLDFYPVNAYGLVNVAGW